MDNDIPIYTNDNFGNTFSKVAIVFGAVWIGSIMFKNVVSPSTTQKYHKEKNHHMRNKNKINKQIESKNRNIKLPPNIDLFTRNKRFNRYF